MLGRGGLECWSGLCQGSPACLGDTTYFNLKVQVNLTWTAFGRPKFDEEQTGFKAPVTRLHTLAEKQ